MNDFFVCCMNRKQRRPPQTCVQLPPQHGGAASDRRWIRPAHCHSSALLRSDLQSPTLTSSTLIHLLFVVNTCLSVHLMCRPGVPAGGQLCRKNAGTDLGPAVQVVWGPGRSCARGTAAVWPLAEQTDGAADPPSQLPPPDQTTAWTLTGDTKPTPSPIKRRFRDVHVKKKTKKNTSTCELICSQWDPILKKNNFISVLHLL